MFAVNALKKRIWGEIFKLIGNPLRDDNMVGRLKSQRRKKRRIPYTSKGKIRYRTAKLK